MHIRSRVFPTIAQLLPYSLALINHHVLIPYHHLHLTLHHEIVMITRQRLAFGIIQELSERQVIRENKRAYRVVAEQVRLTLENVLHYGSVSPKMICLSSHVNDGSFGGQQARKLGK